MNTKLRNKIAGAIYGFAIGDAMGATAEFMTATSIKRKYGIITDIIGGGWLNLQPGEITDDTQMAMCVMNAIMRKPRNIEEFKEYCSTNFIKWLHSGPIDVGGQCLKSICRLENGEAIPVNDEALGNGSLMRAMPMAVLNLPYYNIAQGELTHNNKICSDIIVEYTRVLQRYLYNKPINLYTRKFKRLLEPTGCVLNTYNNSIHWSRKKSFEEAIIGAVNHGGDADTIAAITGSLVGAKFGYDAIPEKWTKTLSPEVKERLEKFKIFVFDCLQI